MEERQFLPEICTVTTQQSAGDVGPGAALHRSLPEHRRLAAERSEGISSEAIYRVIQDAIRGGGLRGTILDYGAGRGEFTRSLLKLGLFDRVCVADLMAVPADLTNRVEWIQQDLNVPIACGDEQFDVVVAVEVIEHLENPRMMMRDLFRLLRRGGTAILSTPNNESWRSLLALLIRGHFVAFSASCYPAHITALVREDLKRIFQEAGFACPAFSFTDEGGLPGRPSVTWQRISGGVLKGLRFSDNVIAIAKKPA